MPRSPSTYSLPPGTTPQQPNTVISSSMFNAFADDVAQTFNTVQPIVYGGTGSNDLKLTDTDFGIKDNGDPTKIGQFNAAGLPTATTRTYDLPYYSGTLGLVSDIRGQIYGLTLSNNGTDPTNDIDIAPGAAVDTTGVASMPLASTLTKRLDAAWAVGNNQGGLDTGSIANTWYAVYLIRRPDTGVVDACFSANLSAPVTGGSIPAAYTQYRRIGYINRVGGAIKTFIQTGDEFLYIDAILDVNTASLGTGGLSFVVSAPPSTSVLYRALINLAAGQAVVIIGTPGQALTPNTPAGNINLVTPAANVSAAGQFENRASSASQLFARSNQASTTFQLVTYGWVDSRGIF